MSATDPVDNLSRLIRCPSVTPEGGGALDVLEEMLSLLGFNVERIVARDANTPDIENLYARKSGNGPHLMFAGHTDVVPVGDAAAWTHPPFAANIANGEMFGRGAVDMKGGIACFIAAVARHIEKHGSLKGSVSFLITGDEEGPAVNGTAKLLDWAAKKGETWDACIVGEPTNPDRLGEMIKIGRRGSVSGSVTVLGTQGHVAYPHLADNPVRMITAMADALMNMPFDEGTENFQPSNLEVTTIDTGNTATNVIAARASLSFNIRFNDNWTADAVMAEIRRRLSVVATSGKVRNGRPDTCYEITWAQRPAHAFLTHDDKLIATLSGAINSVTGATPKLSTTGGTSDARFIKDYCPVVEFGLVGQTMHMVDERVALRDLETQTQIYQTFLEGWFGDAQN